MFRRTILSALVIAAGAGAALAVKLLKDQKPEEPAEEENDEEIHFIKIDDEAEEEDEVNIPSFDASDKSEAVQEIAAVYPYLDPDFIEKTLAKNSGFNEQYEEDTLMTIVHTAELPAETAEGYADILAASGYECEVNGTTVTALRKFFYQSGAIVSDVLNVANQTAALEGTYVKYDLK